MQFTFEAIGTHWWIEVFDQMSSTSSEDVATLITDFCTAFNASYSRFKEDSLVSKLNRDRTLRNAPSEFIEILHTGQVLYERTQGTCNMLIGHILEARGYDAQYSFKADPLLKTLIPGNPLVDVSISGTTINLAQGNIDLGGFGKGYLIDCIAKILFEHGFRYFLINGGGDMYGTSNHHEPIEIVLEHPFDTSLTIGETTVLNQGFAASSPYKRQWRTNGSIYTHIVGTDEAPLPACFVKASTAVTADAFTKCGMLLDEDTLISLAAKERCAFARYEYTTNELWCTANFF